MPPIIPLTGHGRYKRVTIVDGMIVCSRCKVPQPATLEFFGVRSRSWTKLRPTCKMCDGELYKQWWALPENGLRRTKINSEKNSALRLEVLTHYSPSGIIICVCCRESEYQFMTLDHINGIRTEEERANRGGYNLYLWLKKSNFPEGYQVLCYNCNCAKGFYGICPHQTKLLEVVNA